jgi:hypothetical protein
VKGVEQTEACYTWEAPHARAMGDWDLIKDKRQACEETHLDLKEKMNDVIQIYAQQNSIACA